MFKMIELGREICHGILEGEGFKPIARMNSRRFPDNTWRYEKRNEGYIATEITRERIIPWEHYDLESGMFESKLEETGDESDVE